MAIVCVSELCGPALDWAIAVCESLPIHKDPMAFYTGSQAGYWIWHNEHKTRPSLLIGDSYSPSTKWSQAGPIMENYDIYPVRCVNDSDSCEFEACYQDLKEFGETPLIAAMRCVVATRFGNELEIPPYYSS